MIRTFLVTWKIDCKRKEYPLYGISNNELRESGNTILKLVGPLNEKAVADFKKHLQEESERRNPDFRVSEPAITFIFPLED